MEYGKVDYWEDHYSKNEEAFDWLYRWESPNQVKAMKDNLLKYFNADSKILVLGCGTSRLTEELVDEGFEKVTSVDWSSTAIKLCKERYADQEDYKGLAFLEMDVRKMTAFTDG